MSTIEQARAQRFETLDRKMDQVLEQLNDLHLLVGILASDFDEWDRTMFRPFGDGTKLPRRRPRS